MAREFAGRVKSDVHQAVQGAAGQFNQVSDAARRSAEESSGHFRKAFRSIGGQIKSLAAPVLAIGTLVGGFKFFKDAIDNAEAFEKNQKQTAAVIKSTGGAARVTARDVADLAYQLSVQTGITADTVRQNENLLLTFTGIRNEVGKGNDIF